METNICFTGDVYQMYVNVIYANLNLLVERSKLVVERERHSTLVLQAPPLRCAFSPAKSFKCNSLKKYTQPHIHINSLSNFSEQKERTLKIKFWPDCLVAWRNHGQPKRAV